MRGISVLALVGCGTSPSETDAGTGASDAHRDAMSQDMAVDAGDASAEPSWTAVGQDLARGLVSVWGTSASDVWAVGGDNGKGSGPLVVHYDGSSWQQFETGSQGTLWWVFGLKDGPVYMGGENGLILRFEDDAFETLSTPAETTVFGIWGVGDQIWAVGGELEGSTGAQVWWKDGDSFTSAPGLPAIDTAALFKVWGCAEDDVWMVGTGGTALHWDGEIFESVESAANGRTLFTVHVESETCLAAAVGGYGSGEIVENTGAAWANVTPSSGIFATNGVWLTAEGGFAVGIQGQILKRAKGSWSSDLTPPEWSSFFFHAVWVDPEGGAWAVGTEEAGWFPTDQGVLVYRGAAIPAALSDS